MMESAQIACGNEVLILGSDCANCVPAAHFHPFY